MEQNAVQGLVVDRRGRGGIGLQWAALYHFGVLVTMAIVAVQVLASAAGTATKVVPIVRAERFVLVDAEGRELAELGCSPGQDGNPSASLLLRDGFGIERAKLTASSGMMGTGLYLSDFDGIKGQFAVMPVMGATVNLRDDNGRRRLSLDVYPKDGAFLTLSNREGKSVWVIPKTGDSGE